MRRCARARDVRNLLSAGSRDRDRHDRRHRVAEDSIDPPGSDPRDGSGQAPALQSTLTRPEPSHGCCRIGSRRQSSFIADNGYPSEPASGCSIWQNGQIGDFLEPDSQTGRAARRGSSGTILLLHRDRTPRPARSRFCRFDDGNRLRRNRRQSPPEVLAMVTDAAGNLCYSDGNIHRVPATGGASPSASWPSTAARIVSPALFRSVVDTRVRRAGHLLAGGFALIRISPRRRRTGQRFGGWRRPDRQLPGNNLVGYPEPYSGDGLPALQARLVFTYQMAVAADGAVVFTDEDAAHPPDRSGRRWRGQRRARRNRPDHRRLLQRDRGPRFGFATSDYGNFRRAGRRPARRRARSSCLRTAGTSCCVRDRADRRGNRRPRRARPSSRSPRPSRWTMASPCCRRRCSR